jgi:hypothetical protein
MAHRLARTLPTLTAAALLLASGVPAGAQLLFAPPVVTSYPPFAALPRVAAGDVDGDGLADLVLGHAGVPGLRLGDGAGGFGPEAPIDVAATGGTVALADMNGDGALDLLVGSSLTGMFHVTLGAGDGSFALLVSCVFDPATPGQNHLGLSTADADGDGDADVMAIVGGQIVGPAGKARLYRNLGAGTLGLVASVSGMGTQKIVGAFAANLNGDNLPDMVLLYNAGITVPIFSASALLCQPDATFQSLWTSSTEMPQRIADLDGDGDQDLLTLELTSIFGPPPSTLVAQLNAGDGSFAAGPTTSIATPNGASAAALRDLDADGVVDLVLSAAFPPEVWIMRGNGDGGFEAPGVRVTWAPPASAGSGETQLADFDGDGRPDVICAVGSMTPTSFYAVTLNRTYPAGGPLLDLGHALKGGAGWPIQLVEGSFVAGTPFGFALSGAPANGAVYHVVGFSVLNAPFKGGVMVPVPVFVNGPWLADGNGDLLLAGPSWFAGPSGLLLALQFWFADAGGPAGFAASSGVALTLP